MMGRQPNQQQKMFYDRINLDQRIRSDHVLRQIAQYLDFDFIYNEVQETYGANGNVSVPPPVILKMMLLLILYNVRSERELLATIPEEKQRCQSLNYEYGLTAPYNRDKLPAWLGHGG
jgi:transposase